MATIFETDLPENVRSIERRSRTWNGAIVEDIHEHAVGRVVHLMPHAKEARFTVSLAEIGSATECRLKQDQANPVEHSTNHMALISGGLPWWGYAGQLRYARYAMIVFDVPTLEGMLTLAIDQSAKAQAAYDALGLRDIEQVSSFNGALAD